MPFHRIATCLSLLVATQAFQVIQQPTSGRSSTPSIIRPSSTALNHGSIEQLEFKIYPDGRVEESVRGVKGGECHKITDEINAHLGKVVDTAPTEEMFEQKVFVEQTVSVDSEQKDAGWEGQSSW